MGFFGSCSNGINNKKQNISIYRASDKKIEKNYLNIIIKIHNIRDFRLNSQFYAGCNGIVTLL